MMSIEVGKLYETTRSLAVEWQIREEPGEMGRISEGTMVVMLKIEPVPHDEGNPCSSE